MTRRRLRPRWTSGSRVASGRGGKRGSEGGDGVVLLFVRERVGMMRSSPWRARRAGRWVVMAGERVSIGNGHGKGDS